MPCKIESDSLVGKTIAGDGTMSDNGEPAIARRRWSRFREGEIRSGLCRSKGRLDQGSVAGMGD